METSPELRKKLEALPASPGVYLFKNAEGRVIYVGKAKNLAQRVRSYFQDSRDHDRKTRLLVRRVADLDHVVLADEMEALVAENNFIKEYSPRYNIRLKDDKTFPYVRITLEEELPRVFLTRHRLQEGSLYLGPYTDVGVIRQTLRLLKSLFPVRECRGDVGYRSLDRECLYYHIDRCKAPCTGRQSVDDYRAGVDSLRLFLTGKTETLAARMEKEMETVVEKAIAMAQDEKVRILKEAEESAEDIKRQAEAAVNAAVVEAKRNLQEEVAEKAAAMAEELIVKNLTADDQVAITEQYLEKVGAVQ